MRKIYKGREGLGLPELYNNGWSNSLPNGIPTSSPTELSYTSNELAPYRSPLIPKISNSNGLMGSLPTGVSYNNTSGVASRPTENTPKTNNSGGSPGKGFDVGSILGGAGSGLSSINQSIFQNSRYANNEGSQTASQVRNSMSDAAIKSGVPIAMAIGAATKVVDGIMDATGLRSDNISKKTADKVGVSGAARFLNNAMNFLPGNPMALGGKAISDAEKSEDTEKVRGAFAGTLDDIDTAGEMGGTRVNFMLSGKTRGKMENFVQEQNRRNNLLSQISRTNTLRKQSNYSEELASQNYNRYNGSNYQGIAVGKQGMKLDDAQYLKDGGVVGVDSSVIPEGALHRELNHMEEVNKELDKSITDKGIAVVSTDEDGEIKQIAEIEKEELVLRLGITKKIESLWKDGSKEAMVEAGKLLVKELMENTNDNTEEMLDGDN